MCGIAGYTGTEVPGKLEQMIAALQHRGPDEKGYFHASWVHAGTARLAILDRKGGKQPMSNEAGTVSIVMNGEIYNYVELRAQLESEGAVFRTHSDTEVVLRLYERDGINFVHKLNGMFAIGIVDIRTGDLFLIRDQIGEKPLYYTESPSGLEFASEFSAFNMSERHAHIDRVSLALYFSQKAMSGDRTIDDRVRKLLPGHYLRWNSGRTDAPVRYYRITPKRNVGHADKANSVAILETLFEDAVRIRMRADVDVGAFLSGGIDSSLTVAFASRFSSKPIKTYCLVYDEDVFGKKEDAEFARRVSHRFGTHHHEVLLTPKLLMEELPNIARQYAQPNSVAVASWFVCQAMSRDIRVALSGDGADELFGSYFLHRISAAVSVYERTGDEKAFEVLTADENAFARRNLGRPLSLLADDFGVFRSSEYAALLRRGDTFAGDLRRVLEERGAQLISSDVFDRMLEYECNYPLVDQILNYVDVLSMAHSLEVRAPFLDTRIVDFAFGLSPDDKNQGGQTKYLLRQLARRHLPEDLVMRPKEGFVEPNIHWLKNEMKEFCLSHLESRDFDRFGIFNRETVDQWVASFYSSHDFYVGKKVWNLLMYALWEEAYDTR